MSDPNNLPAVLGPAGVSCKLAPLKQARALIRLALRSSAQPQGFCGTGSGSESGLGSGLDSGSNCGDAIATIFIAPHAGITWARGRKTLRTGLSARFLGSDRNFAAQHPQGKPKARRIWALTPKMPESEAGPASIPQTPCGRAEQRRMGRIKILDVRRPRSGLVSKISAPSEQRKESRSDPDFGSPFFSLGFFGEAKKSMSPAAATERHRNSSMNRLMEKEQGLDKLCAPCPELVKGSARSFDTSGRTAGKKAWTTSTGSGQASSARTAKRKHQSPTPC